MEENLSLGRQLFHRVWLQGWMSKVIRFLCFWVLLVVKMLLVVSVVPFLLVVVVVVVLLLWLGRLEVGHWRKALLAKVVFNCPPLHLVLQQDSKTRSRSWDVEWCIVPSTRLSTLPLPQREGHQGPDFGSYLDSVWVNISPYKILLRFYKFRADSHFLGSQTWQHSAQHFCRSGAPRELSRGSGPSSIIIMCYHYVTIVIFILIVKVIIITWKHSKNGK